MPVTVVIFFCIVKEMISESLKLLLISSAPEPNSYNCKASKL